MVPCPLLGLVRGRDQGMGVSPPLDESWELWGICMGGGGWVGFVPGLFCGHLLGFHDPQRQLEDTQSLDQKHFPLPSSL